MVEYRGIKFFVEAHSLEEAESIFYDSGRFHLEKSGPNSKQRYL